MSHEELKIMELLDVLDRLKHLKRTGWLHYKIPEPETVASHMYRMAVLAMSLHPSATPVNASNSVMTVDTTHCVKMALVHDIGEAIVGDITPRCGISNDEKFRLEENAINSIAKYVPTWIGDEWRALWLEYEGGSTQEARMVKQLDKFDMLAQAFSYEQRYDLDLSDFFESTPSQTFTTSPFINWDNDLRNKRDAWRSAKR